MSLESEITFYNRLLSVLSPLSYRWTRTAERRYISFPVNYVLYNTCDNHNFLTDDVCTYCRSDLLALQGDETILTIVICYFGSSNLLNNNHFHISNGFTENKFL